MDRESAFEAQLFASLTTIERILNNGTAASEAGPALALAVEAVARSVPLPSPIAAPTLALVDESLAAMRAEFDALARSAYASPAGFESAGAETPHAAAARHHAAAVAAQTRLNDAVRSAAQRAANASAVVRADRAWLSETLESADYREAAARLDYAGAMRLLAAKLDARLAGRARPAPARATDLAPYRPVAGDKPGSALVSALLQRDKVPRVTRMTYVGSVQPAGAATVASATRLQMPAVGEVATFSDGPIAGVVERIANLLAPPALADVGIEFALPRYAEYLKAQSVWAWLDRLYKRFFESSDDAHQRFAAERLDALGAWTRYVEAAYPAGDVQLKRIIEYYESFGRRLTRLKDRQLDKYLNERTKFIRAQAVAGRISVWPLSFAELVLRQTGLQVKASEVAKEVDAERISAGQVSARLKQDVDAVIAEWKMFVGNETVTMQYFGTFTEELLKAGAAPSGATKPKVEVAAAVVDCRSQTAVAPEQTNVSPLVATAVAAASTLKEPAERAGVLLEGATNTPANAAQPGRLEVAASTSGDGKSSFLGVQNADVTLRSDVDTGAESLFGGAANALINNRPALLLPPDLESQEFEALLDRMNNEAADERGLGRGLDSQYAPTAVMRYFRQWPEAPTSRLARFLYLIEYVGAIGEISLEEDQRRSFAVILNERVGVALGAEQYGITGVVRQLEALAGNQGSGARLLQTLPPAGSRLRTEMQTYCDEFIKTADEYGLTFHWSFASVLGTVARRDSVGAQIERLPLTDEARRSIGNEAATTLQSVVYQAFLAAARQADLDLYRTRRHVQSVWDSTPRVQLASHTFNAGAIDRARTGTMISVDWVDTGQPLSGAERFVLPKQQRVLVRNTLLCRKDEPLAACPWAIATNSTPVGTFDQIIAQSPERRALAFLRIGDQRAPLGSAALLAGAFGGGGIAVSAAAAERLGDSVASALADAPLDSRDNAGFWSFIGRLFAEPQAPSAGSLLDSGIGWLKSLNLIGAWWNQGAPLVGMCTQVFQAMTHLTYWVELACRAAGFVLRRFPRITAKMAELASAVHYYADLLWVVTVARAIEYAIPLSGASAGVRATWRTFRAWLFAKPPASTLTWLYNYARSFVSSEPPPPPAPTAPAASPLTSKRIVTREVLAEEAMTLSELADYAQNRLQAGLATVMNVLGRFALSLGLTAATGMIQLAVVAGETLGQLLGKVLGSFGAIIGASGASTTDIAHTIANGASFVMLFAVAPTLIRQYDTLTQTLVWTSVVRMTTTAAVDLVASAIAAFSTDSSRRESVAVSREKWRQHLTLLATIGIALPPWVAYATQSTIGSWAPAVAGIVPGVSYAPGATDSEYNCAVEVTVLAGGAMARMWGSRLFAWLLLTTIGRRYRGVDHEALAVSAAVAFSQQFVNSLSDASLPADVRADAYSIWGHLAARSVDVVDNRLAPIADPRAEQMYLVGANIIRFLRGGKAPRTPKEVRDLMQMDEAARVVARVAKETLERSAFNAKLYPAYARTILGAAVSGVDLERLLLEAIGLWRQPVEPWRSTE